MKDISAVQFKQIAEAIPHIVWTADTNGDIDYVSKQAIDYSGTSREEQLGMKWLQFVHPDDKEKALSTWMKAVHSGQMFDMEYRLRRHDNKYFWMKACAVPIHDPDGKITKWFGTCTDINDSKLAQIRYERNIDITPALLWATNQDGSNIYLNQQWLDFTGQTPEEGHGKGWLNTIHPDDRERISKLVQEAQAKREKFRFEYRIKHKDGVYRWAVDSGNPRYDQDGNYQGYSGVVFDIQDQKDVRELLENFWNLPGNMLAISDTKTSHFIELSPAWEVTLGYTVEEIKGRTWMSFVHPDDMKDTMKQGAKLLDGERLIGFENRYRTKNGDWVWLSWTVHPVGEKLYCRVTDVTERKLALQRLEESEKRFRFYTEAMPQMFFIADPKGNITFFNKRHYEYFGINPEDDEGWKWTEQQIHHPDDLNRTIVTWQKSLRTGVPYQIEYRLRRHDGVYRWHLGLAIPIRDENGNIREWLGTNTDIHDAKTATEELKDLTKKLQAALQSRDEFISIASHELKTPITSIKLKNQMQLRALAQKSASALDPEKVENLAHETDVQISRLARLVNDMLDVSKIRLGQFTLNKERVLMSELVKHVIQYMTPEFHENKCPVPEVRIIKDAQGDWDRIRIEQIIQNILSNGIKYSDCDSLRITIDLKGDFICVAIKDQGPGISEELQERIFERFERGVKASEISGMGLGLFISQQIALAHHGKITVKSKLGEGCTFTLALPISK
ncbi:PAS domain-containing sensor histidine kinase [Peredibacter starrii]|uniref:histidine kinase n=1 Tax=Peredibacter starrii TaxID=28202 RepID=A0AAX4HUG5_9BACT|nr:PAS domain-containing protein [Peredibacter starrii]WPU66600.1 PAS domain-containing protein [Peredibacter starrii]